jgi:hypothetical protein
MNREKSCESRGAIFVSRNGPASEKDAKYCARRAPRFVKMTVRREIGWENKKYDGCVRRRGRFFAG